MAANGRAVLVTGGAGYIGSHAAKALHRGGYRVVVYDNFVAGHRGAVKYGELVTGDICDLARLRQTITQHEIFAVMHFAAFLDVGESVRQPAKYYRNNVSGALTVLEAIAAEQVRLFVFSSTCATYGEPLETPISESHPQQPVNPYGKTKLVVEHALRDHAEAYGLRSVSLRYFNAAGCDPSGELGERHDPETHLIPLALIEALRVRAGGDPAKTGLRVFGGDFVTPDGTCIRDYIHVNDLCSAHLLALGRLLQNRVAGAEAYNLGNGQGFSVLEVIDACRRVTGQDIRYEMAPRRAGDPAQLVGASRRAREELEWRPVMTSLDDIVGSAWNWFSRQPQSGTSR